MALRILILSAMLAVAAARPGYLATPTYSYGSYGYPYGSQFYGGDYDLGYSHHHHAPAVSYQSSTLYHTKPIVTPVVKSYVAPLSVSHYPYHGLYDSHDLYGGYGGYGYGGYGGYGAWKSW